MRRSRAFTLVELLVVIAIIGVITSIVFVNLRGSREKARIAGGYKFSQSINHALGAYAVGIWSFDRYGDPISDLSGYNNDCFFFGGTDPQEAEGIIRRAISFNGSNYLDCGNNESLDITDKITIEVWVNPNVAGEGGDNISPVSKAETLVGWSWQLRYNAPGGYMGFQFNGNPEGSTWVSVKQNLSPGSWYHIAGTFDGTNIKCYLNGLEKDVGQISAITGSDSGLFIGQDGWDNNFNGLVDEVRIYNEALIAGEIQKHYVGGAIRHGIVFK